MPPDDAERAIAEIERSLADGRPARPRTSCASGWTPSACEPRGRRSYHLLFAASLRGLIVRGPMVDGKHAYVLVSDWLGEPKPVDRDRALPEFARRYLAGHGPASDRDLARWAGLPLRDARARARRHRVRARGARRRPRGPEAPTEAAELPPPKLLGAYEPLLLGWTSREDVLGDSPGARDGRTASSARSRWSAAGQWRAGACRAARWRWSRSDAWRRPTAAALEAEAADVVRFLAGCSAYSSGEGVGLRQLSTRYTRKSDDGPPSMPAVSGRRCQPR